MAATGLGGAAMATPVVGDDAIAVIEEEQHLGVPIIGRQRPTVTENNGLTFAPILEIDLDPVLCRNCVHSFIMHSISFLGTYQSFAVMRLTVIEARIR